MPLHQVITVNPTTQILLWKITESYEQLMAEVALKEKSTKRLEGMKSELHRRGFLSVRKLLAQIGYTDFDLHYDATGKPHLKDGTHISISHSHEFSAIIVSDQIVGIDLELCREKAAVIAHKFVHEAESKFMDPTDPEYIQKLTVLWGVKEVIFKIRNEIGISFKDHVRAESFNIRDKKTIAYLEMDAINLAFPIYFEIVENFVLVYAFEA
jgi:4'-phosphopantetheinyl transferase